MKIALIGNNNNNMNSLTRYLRDLGYDADLLLFNNEFPHFLPSCDTFGDDYLHYCKQLDWGTYSSLYFTSSHKIQKDLKEYSFFIGSRLSPAFLNRINLSLDLFIPTGGEVWTLPFFAGFRPQDLVKFFLFSKLQRDGIKKSKYILFDYTNELVEEKINLLGFTTKNRLMTNPPFIYLDEYEDYNLKQNFEKSKLYTFFQSIRQQFKLVIFHHSAHWWKNIPASYHHDKGNDRLIKGFAYFVKAHPDVSACIVTVKYGVDWEASRQLCQELGIMDRVFWLDKTIRKELMVGIYHSDVVAGEFRNSWYSYGTIFEGLAMKRLVLHYRNDELYSDAYSEMYPMVSASQPEEISHALEKIYYSPELREKIGMGGYRWFKEYAVDRPLNQIVELIERSLHS